METAAGAPVTSALVTGTPDCGTGVATRDGEIDIANGTSPTGSDAAAGAEVGMDTVAEA